MPYLVILGMLSKKNCHILNQQPQIREITNFCPKIKILKFGTKTALIEYFKAVISTNYSHN